VGGGESLTERNNGLCAEAARKPIVAVADMIMSAVVWCSGTTEKHLSMQLVDEMGWICTKTGASSEEFPASPVQGRVSWH